MLFRSASLFKKESGTHLRPRIAIASLRSIFALKPPFTNCSAPFLPTNMPCLIRERPKTAAAIALTPRMTGVAMSTKQTLGTRRGG